MVSRAPVLAMLSSVILESCKYAFGKEIVGKTCWILELQMGEFDIGLRVLLLMLGLET